MLNIKYLIFKTLIFPKKETISDKDKAVIPILERTLEEKRKRSYQKDLGSTFDMKSQSFDFHSFSLWCL